MSEEYKELPEAKEILECKKKRPLSTFEFGFMRGCEYAYEHQQAKVDGLQQDLEAQREETIKGYTKISDLRLQRDELQKRVDFLENHLKPCECGSKEICVDQEGYITKHCYRCGGIKSQEMIEQALKGEV